MSYIETIYPSCSSDEHELKDCHARNCAGFGLGYYTAILRPKGFIKKQYIHCYAASTDAEAKKPMSEALNN